VVERIRASGVRTRLLVGLVGIRRPAVTVTAFCQWKTALTPRRDTQPPDPMTVLIGHVAEPAVQVVPPIRDTVIATGDERFSVIERLPTRRTIHDWRRSARLLCNHCPGASRRRVDFPAFRFRPQRRCSHVEDMSARQALRLVTRGARPERVRIGRPTLRTARRKLHHHQAGSGDRPIGNRRAEAGRGKTA
jgi:hypothetical protein